MKLSGATACHVWPTMWKFADEGCMLQSDMMGPCRVGSARPNRQSGVCTSHAPSARGHTKPVIT
eukprot:1158421-Pelagomonas_calceolata.AAC.3